MRILVLKSADRRPHSISLAPAGDGDAVDIAYTLDAAIDLLREQSFDAAVVISIPPGSAARLCAGRLRTSAPGMPVLVIAEPEAQNHDVLVPITRRASLHVDIDYGRQRVSINNTPLPLSEAEFCIFALLWERRGDTVPAEQLMDALYGSEQRPASRVLPVFVFKLRRKLENAGLPGMIETSVGRGFALRLSDSPVAAGQPAPPPRVRMGGTRE